MFKIRKKFFPEAGHEICEKKYADFLDRKRAFLSDELFAMFHYDYFHDGYLSAFHYNFEKANIKWEISCPNFITVDKNYIDVDYYLNFHNVSYFEVNAKKREVNFADATFLYGELGTLACTQSRISLIVQFITSGALGSFYVAIVCERIDVIPKEPLALKLLLDTHAISLDG